jgi:hypothetical protein
LWSDVLIILSNQVDSFMPISLMYWLLLAYNWCAFYDWYWKDSWPLVEM